MRIGVPKETKVHEYRVGLSPTSVAELTALGHDVVVGHNAGAAIGFSNDDYVAAGGCIGSTPEAFDQDLVVKVKEPNLDECSLLRDGQILFTYLHLAANPDLTSALVASGAAAIAYETVTADDGSLPLLSPMSEIAGRMSVQVGANALQRTGGGSGVLLGGVPGVAPRPCRGGRRRHGWRQCGDNRPRPRCRRDDPRQERQPVALVGGPLRRPRQDGHGKRLDHP